MPTIGKHKFSNCIQQLFFICRIICYIYVVYSYFFQFMSISEIIFTITIPISYFHTIFRQFQLFNIIHLHEIASISICITYIVVQIEIFDVRTYILPRFIFISLHYVLLFCIIIFSFPIGKCNTINSIQIYLTGFFGQSIGVLWIFIILYSYRPSIKKCSQSVRIFIFRFTIDVFPIWNSIYLNIIRPSSRLTIRSGKLDSEVISVR